MDLWLSDTGCDVTFAEGLQIPNLGFLDPV